MNGLEPTLFFKKAQEDGILESSSAEQQQNEAESVENIEQKEKKTTESSKIRKASKSEADKQAAYSRLLDGHYVKNGSSSDVARETLHEEDFHLILSGRSDVDLKDTFRSIAMSATKEIMSSSRNGDEEESSVPADAEGKIKTPRQRSVDIPWTEEEKNALILGYERYGSGSNKWTKIKLDPEFGELLQKRSNGDLKDKYRNIQLSMSRMGDRPPKREKTNDSLWSEEEKNALLQGYERYGLSSNKWRKIQMDPEFGEILRKRSNGDLKDKYRNIQLALARGGDRVNKREKTGDTLWTEEEKQALLQGHERYGMCNNKWRKIQTDPDFAAILARRTNGDLKDKFRNIQLPMARNGSEPRKREKGGDLPWSEEEKQALLQGYERYSMTLNKWIKIKQDPELGEILQKRSERGLKVKYRNMMITASGGSTRKVKKERSSGSSILPHMDDEDDDDGDDHGDEDHGLDEQGEVSHLELGILEDHGDQQSDGVMNLSSIVIVQDPLDQHLDHHLDATSDGKHHVDDFPFQLSNQSYPSIGTLDSVLPETADDASIQSQAEDFADVHEGDAAKKTRKRKAMDVFDSFSNVGVEQRDGDALDLQSESRNNAVNNSRESDSLSAAVAEQ